MLKNISMKITLYFTTLLLSFLMHSQEQPIVLVNANYHNRSCAGGIGLCSESGSFLESKETSATLEKKNENEIVLMLDLKNFSTEEIEQLQTEKNFSVSGTKNLSLDKNILSRLNINAQYSEIHVGNYPIQVTTDKVQVTLTLSKK